MIFGCHILSVSLVFTNLVVVVECLGELVQVDGDLHHQFWTLR